jgi:hypothetical protein
VLHNSTLSIEQTGRVYFVVANGNIPIEQIGCVASRNIPLKPAGRMFVLHNRTLHQASRTKVIRVANRNLPIKQGRTHICDAEIC